MSKPKLILDLCGGTGSWSKPYQASKDYQVLIVDPIHEPYLDVLDHVQWLSTLETHVYGILAAPPCTDFAVSGARWYKDKDASGRTQHSIDILNACLDIIESTQPTFWCLENPKGRILPNMLGKPNMVFDPFEFGDYYTKRTHLWGSFNKPLTLSEQIQQYVTTNSCGINT